MSQVGPSGSSLPRPNMRAVDPEEEDPGAVFSHPEGTPQELEMNPLLTPGETVLDALGHAGRGPPDMSWLVAQEWCEWLTVMSFCMIAILIATPCWCCVVTFTVAWSAVGAWHLATLHQSCSTVVLDFSWYAVLGSFLSTLAGFALVTYITYLHRFQIQDEVAKAKAEFLNAYGSVTSYASNTVETFNTASNMPDVPKVPKVLGFERPE